ncbi:hypothetical protein HB771_17250 [Rhizobium leguminosarum bv. viciae]|nr:hypothetical protein HB771_17250 [Rhizobium leguminosarum bv. viciae]
MAKLFRFIFRFDFENGYALVDRPGTVQRTLVDVSPNFWTAVGPSNQAQQIAATKQNDDRPNRSVCNVTVELNAISGQIEVEQGIDLVDLYDDEFLKVCDKACSSLMETFQLSKMKRVGARFLLSGGASDKSIEMRSNYCKAVSKTFVPEKLLSEISVTDAAIHLIGTMDNDVKYRLVTGPGADDDRRKFFSVIHLSDREITETNFGYSVDLDLYQENINFKGTHLLRWLKAKQSHLDRMLMIARASAER